jgi:hypothetical protein
MKGKLLKTTLRGKAQIDEILDQSAREERQLLLTGSRAGMNFGVWGLVQMTDYLVQPSV